MPSQRVDFTGSQGEALAGRLDTPDVRPQAWAVFAHCFTCSKDSKAAAYIARALTEAGYGVLRFDFTGLGGSGGDFANTHFSSNVDDLVAAADWLREQHGAPALLIGHSLGGAAVLAAAARVPDCKAVATLGAPCDPAHVTHQLGNELAVIESQGEASVVLGGRPFTVKRSFVEDLADQPQSERIRSLGRPLLVLHAPGDDTVSVDNARRIFETAMHPKSFVALDGADHLLNHAEDARFAAGLIAAWARRYVEATELPVAPKGACRRRLVSGRRGCGAGVGAWHGPIHPDRGRGAPPVSDGRAGCDRRATTRAPLPTTCSMRRWGPAPP